MCKVMRRHGVPASKHVSVTPVHALSQLVSTQCHAAAGPHSDPDGHSSHRVIPLVARHPGHVERCMRRCVSAVVDRLLLCCFSNVCQAMRSWVRMTLKWRPLGLQAWSEASCPCQLYLYLHNFWSRMVATQPPTHAAHFAEPQLLQPLAKIVSLAAPHTRGGQ